MTMQPGSTAKRGGTDQFLVSRTTTATAAVRDRFDYWRHLFFGSYIDLPDRDRGADFRGDMLGCTGDGVAYSNLRADPLICSFGQRDSGLMLLGAVHAGTWQVRHGHDGATVMDSGSGLLLFDCDRPSVARSTRYNLSYLILPRSAVVAALGRTDPVPRGEAFLKLPPRGLTPILLSHLRAMADHGAGLSDEEGAAAMKAATALAMSLLSGLRAPAERRDEEHDDALFEAARRHIVLNCGRFDLTVDHVAAAVGCSRAHLYRVFASHDRTVAGDLREVRLRRARRLIETQAGRPIGMIAFDCGYTDLTAFGKAFRRRYGCSPSDWRAKVEVEGSSAEPPDGPI
jgi:AraC-like DNA-binding protein